MKTFAPATFRVGELRKLTYRVIPQPGTIASVITEARAYLVGGEGDLSVEIDGTAVNVYFPATTAGTYELRVFITVPPETIECEKTIRVLADGE